MDAARTLLRTTALTLLLLATAFGLTLAPHATGVAGAAGSNSADGLCVKAFNYADPQQGLLYAITESRGCQFVQVKIFNQAIRGGGPGFEDSNCNGTEQWAFASGEMSVGVMAFADVWDWDDPCSQHGGVTGYTWWPVSSGAIYFKCSHPNCHS